VVDVRRCNRDSPNDDSDSDCWSFPASGYEQRLWASALVGQHSVEHSRVLVLHFHRRSQGKLVSPMTCDEAPEYV
jgi:hypothetical protein